MDRVRGPIGKWLLSTLYLGVWVGLSLLLPWGLGKWFVLIHLLFAAWLYLTHDSRYGRSALIRPLTPWDVSDYPSFRANLQAASQTLGLRREPLWAVVNREELNASAIGGSRGIVVFTTGLLRTMSDAELLAVAGHELCHVRSHDSLPAIVGSAWLLMVGRLSGWCRQTGRGRGLTQVLLQLLSLFLDLVLWVMGYLASVILAKRSRTAEHLADRAGARVTSVATMCAALERLERVDQGGTSRDELPRWSMEWMQQRLHASHPPTAERLAYLQAQSAEE